MAERIREAAGAPEKQESIQSTEDASARVCSDYLECLRETTKDVLREARRSGRISQSEIEELKAASRDADLQFRTYEKSASGASTFTHNVAMQRTERAYENLAKEIISAQAENRGVWFDRKDVVGSGPGELSKRILELKKAGITTIYIECNNGGYALYDSKLMKANPDLEKWPRWDPLREAIDTAHANGIKVEAWTKVFAVCNRALDDQFKQKYPNRKFPPAGPVLEQHDKASPEDPYGDWTLRMYDGKLPERTHDVFLDPANPPARKFAQDMLLEIAERYPDIDGIQYDYIRYPFKNEGMGINQNNWKQFQTDNPQHANLATPSHPTQIKGQTLKDWNEWKNKQIDSFVLDTSNKLRQLNAKLDISAAVYPCDLNEGVRQQWSRWLKNGSLDTLNPMTYVPHDANSRDAPFTPEFERKFKADIREIQHASNKKGTLLPGVMVSRVNTQGMMSQIHILRQLKLPGETLFATSVLDPTRLKSLELDTGRTAFADFQKLSNLALAEIERHAFNKSQCRHLKDDTELTARSIEEYSKQQEEEFRMMQSFSGSDKRIAHHRSSGDNSAGSNHRVEFEQISARINSLQTQLEQLLSANPKQRTIWTERLSTLLQISAEGLSASSK